MKESHFIVEIADCSFVVDVNTFTHLHVALDNNSLKNRYDYRHSETPESTTYSITLYPESIIQVLKENFK